MPNSIWTDRLAFYFNVENYVLHNQKDILVCENKKIALAFHDGRFRIETYG